MWSCGCFHLQPRTQTEGLSFGLSKKVMQLGKLVFRSRKKSTAAAYTSHDTSATSLQPECLKLLPLVKKAGIVLIPKLSQHWWHHSHRRHYAIVLTCLVYDNIIIKKGATCRVPSFPNECSGLLNTYQKPQSPLTFFPQLLIFHWVTKPLHNQNHNTLQNAEVTSWHSCLSQHGSLLELC